MGATYYTATGDPFHNMGQFDLEWTTENGNHKHVKFNHAKVSIPILSMSRWNNRGHKSILDDDQSPSYTVEKATGAEDPVIHRHGTYFMNMYVPTRFLNMPRGFVKPGLRDRRVSRMLSAEYASKTGPCDHMSGLSPMRGGSCE